MGAFHPWRALRSRPHITLRFRHLPRGSDGLLLDEGAGRRLLVLAARLTRVERRHVLTHELVHDERDLLYVSTTPSPMVAKEEAIVEAETVRRLVPLDELAELAARVEATPEMSMTVAEIADHFDVPVRVARDAVRQLELDRARRRHPSARG